MQSIIKFDVYRLMNKTALSLQCHWMEDSETKRGDQSSPNTLPRLVILFVGPKGIEMAKTTHMAGISDEF
jgi:hypothetical protein